ncbi:hypothetical protein WMF26_27420 [Sorangium sp. So ce185]|uniref:hypothetical protein n=1 Tax=Sorangium sp. So ce185 TaxID=3133287 RepID=UPI003F6300BD
MQAVTEANSLWSMVFPLVARARERRDGERGVALVMLDSNAPSRTILSNAYGYVERQVLQRLPVLSALLRQEGYEPVVVLHHHPGLHEDMSGVVLNREGHPRDAHRHQRGVDHLRQRILAS